MAEDRRSAATIPAIEASLLPPWSATTCACWAHSLRGLPGHRRPSARGPVPSPTQLNPGCQPGFPLQRSSLAQPFWINCRAPPSSLSRSPPAGSPLRWAGAERPLQWAMPGPRRVQPPASGPAAPHQTETPAAGQQGKANQPARPGLSPPAAPGQGNHRSCEVSASAIAARKAARRLAEETMPRWCPANCGHQTPAAQRDSAPAAAEPLEAGRWRKQRQQPTAAAARRNGGDCSGQIRGQQRSAGEQGTTAAARKGAKASSKPLRWVPERTAERRSGGLLTATHHGPGDPGSAQPLGWVGSSARKNNTSPP